MRSTFLLVVASLALAIPGLAMQWIEYRPASGAFRIEFPGQPTETSKTLPSGVTLRSADLTLANGVFMTMVVSPMSPQIAARPVQELLDTLRNAQLKATNGKLREEHTVTVNGATGRRLIIDTPKPVVLYIQLLPRGDTLYQVTYSAPGGTEELQDIKRLLDSFKLLTN